MFEPVRVGAGGEFRQLVDERHVFIFCLGLEIGENFFHERMQCERVQVQVHPPGFQRGNGEQILDEQVEPFGVALDDFQETLGDFGIVARAVEERFNVAFDERERRAEFMADVGDEVFARAFELLEPREIVEDEDRAFAFAGGIGDDGGVDPQPAPAQFRQLQFVVKNLSLGLDAVNEISKLMQSQGFHDGLAAQLGLDAEKIFEGAVGEINPAFAVEQQQSFQHGIEQHLLLRLRFNGGLLLAAAGVLHLGVNPLLLAKKFIPPPEVEADRTAEGEDGQEGPHEGEGD